MNKQAFVFDVDNTLTPPRRPLEMEMAEALRALPIPFLLAAGSDPPLVREQFFEPLWRFGFRGELDAFLCNGSDRYRCILGGQVTMKEVDCFSLREHLGEEAFSKLVTILEQTLEDPEFRLPESVSIVGERIIDRRSMINLAPSGRLKGALSDEARKSREQFIAFDQHSLYRQRVLAHVTSRIAAELAGRDIRVTLGGETSFDVVAAGRNKTYPVNCLLAEGFERVTYIGDALYPNGNDAAVLDLVENWASGPCPIEVVRVGGWQETLAWLNEQ